MYSTKQPTNYQATVYVYGPDQQANFGVPQMSYHHLGKTPVQFLNESSGYGQAQSDLRSRLDSALANLSAKLVPDDGWCIYAAGTRFTTRLAYGSQGWFFDNSSKDFVINSSTAMDTRAAVAESGLNSRQVVYDGTTYYSNQAPVECLVAPTFAGYVNTLAANAVDDYWSAEGSKLTGPQVYQLATDPARFMSLVYDIMKRYLKPLISGTTNPAPDARTAAAYMRKFQITVSQ